MSFYDSENWVTLSSRESLSLSKRYKCIIEEKKLRFTSLIMKRVQIFDLLSLNSENNIDNKNNGTTYIVSESNGNITNSNNNVSNSNVSNSNISNSNVSNSNVSISNGNVSNSNVSISNGNVSISNVSISNGNVSISDCNLNNEDKINNANIKMIKEFEYSNDYKLFWHIWTISEPLYKLCSGDDDHCSMNSKTTKIEYLLYQSNNEPGATLLSIDDGKIIENKIETSYTWTKCKINPSNTKLAIVCDKKSRHPIIIYDIGANSIPQKPDFLIKPEDIVAKDYYKSKIMWVSNDELLITVPNHNKNDELNMGFDCRIDKVIVNITTKIVNTDNKYIMTKL